jgi:hypothetical protein
MGQRFLKPRKKNIKCYNKYLQQQHVYEDKFLLPIVDDKADIEQ